MVERAPGPVAVIETMLDMVMDQFSLRVTDGLFNGVELLPQFETGSPLLDHGNDRFEVTLGAFQPRHDARVGGMFHGEYPIPLDRI